MGSSPRHPLYRELSEGRISAQRFVLEMRAMQAALKKSSKNGFDHEIVEKRDARKE